MKMNKKEKINYWIRTLLGFILGYVVGYYILGSIIYNLIN